MLPFLKWAGGKRWLVTYIESVAPEFNRYIEPFLGSGSVFFALAPNYAILTDSNPNLIRTYQAVSANPRLVVRYLQEHARQHSDSYYYRIRDSHYRSEYKQAAQFIYLNRTCWNGLYRENKNGKFNVPRGTKNRVLLPTDDFGSTSTALQTAEIYTSDFEHVIDRAEDGDFLYVDPPYTVAHNVNGFLKYNAKLFNWSDQIRLKQALDRASLRGAYVLVSNADHDSVHELYADYRIERLSRQSVISGNSKYRKTSTELIARCW